jgi:hypothetical protein
MAGEPMRNLLKGACASCALVLASSPASAQVDNDIAVVGPSGRSDVGLLDEFFRSTDDRLLHGTALQMGQMLATDNTLIPSAIYAINERLSVSASLPVALMDNESVTWRGSSHDTSHTGLGDAFGISAALLGDFRSPGLRLVANAGETRVAGQEPTYYGEFLPQYRLGPDLLITPRLGMDHVMGGGNSQYAFLEVLWTFVPSVSLIPDIGLTHYDGNDAYSDYHSWTAGLSVTDHLDTNWALTAGASWSRDSPLSASHSLEDIANGRVVVLTLGVVYLF